MAYEAVLIGGPAHGQVRDISRWAGQVQPYPDACTYLYQEGPLPTEEAWRRYLERGPHYGITTLRYRHVAACNGVHYYGLV